MPSGGEPPEVLPSAPDDEYECVRAEAQATRAPAPGEPGEGLCPPGYVPRLKRRASYHLQGKEAVVDGGPERNPEGNEERRTGDARS